ncbi:hypothetical protein CKO51_08695 [Rhodopirellula sp. SM50]|nr:hypothetical protein CKO51_08695 [Rhodopirellula sp. SM50]
MPTQSPAKTRPTASDHIEHPAHPQTVRFTDHLHAVHRRRGADRALISEVHFKHAKALDTQGPARFAFGRIRLSVKEKHPRPHNAINEGVMRR